MRKFNITVNGKTYELHSGQGFMITPDIPNVYIADEKEPCKCLNMREHFHVKDGHYTVARIDQDHGKYSILAGECDSAEGPYTFGTYMWAKFNDLNKWERKMVEGPYIHHVSEIEGNFTEEIKEFCKYVPSLTADVVE